MSETLPQSIGIAKLTILGFDLECHVLDNGERVFEAESFKRFMEAWFGGELELAEDDIVRLARFVKGEVVENGEL